MSLKEWANHGWLKPHKTSPQEINNLLQIVDRDLTDAEEFKSQVVEWLKENHPQLIK